MATTNSRTAVVDIDGMSATAAAAAINAAIETLELAGFVVTRVDFEAITRWGHPKQPVVLVGVLPAYAGDANGIGLVKALSLDVSEADLTATAASETLDFASSLPEASYPLGVRIGLATPFSGGVVADFTVDVGFAGDLDALVDGADVFTAAVDGEASAITQGIAPNKKVTGSAAARLPKATFRCASDDVADATAGDCTITLLYV
jgi:hypothetical protein